ncbi:MAG: diguanylate cyclase domain-containing protein [Huintestinicola sp.]
MKKRLMGLRNKILLLTILPATLLMLVSASVMTVAMRHMIDGIFRTGTAGSTELACSRAAAVVNEYTSLISRKSDESCFGSFFKTADDRDNAENNAYYSYVLAELDSIITQHGSYAESAWAASLEHPDLIVTNSSYGIPPSGDFDLTQTPFYKPFIESNEDTYVTDPYSGFGGQEKVVSVVSVVRDVVTDKALGIIGIDISPDFFYSKMDIITRSSETTMFIRSGNGIVMYAPDKNDIMGEFSRIELEFRNFDGMINNYKLKGVSMAGSCSAIPNSSWTVYSLKPTSGIKKMVFSYSVLIIGLFTAILLILVILMFIASGMVAKPLQNYTRKINNIHFDEESLNWSDEDLLVPDGCRELEHFAIGFNSLIQRNREMLEELHQMNIETDKERRLYQTALESSPDIVFEYDIASDVLISYGSIWEKDATKTLQSETKNFVSSFIDRDEFVFPERNSFITFFETSEITQQVRFGYKNPDGNICWYSCDGKPIYDKNNKSDKPVKIVGKFTNIDDLVSLKSVAECDALTGFLNKISTENYISSYLSKNEFSENAVHAVALIDIDNFKSLNDKFGHAAGDAALVEIASKIRSIFRESDILGRIGGDEFLVFMKNIPDKEVCSKICRRICDMVRKTYTNDSGISVTISSSVGVSLYSEHGRDFNSLYKAADIAMYLTKARGKNDFTIYNGEERPQYVSDRT